MKTKMDLWTKIFEEQNFEASLQHWFVALGDIPTSNNINTHQCVQTENNQSKKFFIAKVYRDS